MKKVSIGIHALMLIAVLVMQSAGSWYCLATDSLCSVSAIGTCASQQPCCGSDSERDQAPSCCVEIALEPQMVSDVEKFQQPEPSEADLPKWAVFGSANRSAETDSSGRFFAGVDPPPGHSVLTARLCVRQI